jgi:radical SAM protein with 4Fe4S-binding SPASM domain
MAKLAAYLGYARRIARRELDYRLGKLRSASLELTYRCNLKCEICSLWRIPPGEIKELSLEEWLRVVDELAGAGVSRIGLIGGEPTIVAGFHDVMKRTKEHGIRLDVTTNGTTLARHLEGLCSYVDILYISVDAPNELHDQIRGIPGLLQRVIKATRALVDYKREHRLHKPEIHIHYTVTRHNVHLICDMVRLCDELGVDVVSFQYVTCSPQSAVDASVMDGKCVASDRYTVNDIGSLLLDEDGVRVFRSQFAALPETKNVVAVVNPISNLSDKSLLTGEFPVKRCMPVNYAIVIQPDGEATVCSQITGYSLGNVRESSIEQIWRGEARRQLRERLSRRMFPVCRNCCAFSSSLTMGQMFRIALGRRL